MRKAFQKSFTLVEILVYIGVFCLIIVIIVSFVLWLVRSNTKVKVAREVLDNAQRVMEIMTYEIMGAKSIYTPTTNSNQLSLETTKYLPEGEETTYIDFYLCDARLCLKKESQNPIFLTSENVEVNNLVFTRILSGEAPSVRINLTVNYKNPADRQEYQASINLVSSASLRSY